MHVIQRGNLRSIRLRALNPTVRMNSLSRLSSFPQGANRRPRRSLLCVRFSREKARDEMREHASDSHAEKRGGCADLSPSRLCARRPKKSRRSTRENGPQDSPGGKYKPGSGCALSKTLRFWRAIFNPNRGLCRKTRTARLGSTKARRSGPRDVDAGRLKSPGAWKRACGCGWFPQYKHLVWHTRPVTKGFVFSIDQPTRLLGVRASHRRDRL